MRLWQYFPREFFLFCLAFGVHLTVFFLLAVWFIGLGNLPDLAAKFPVLVGDSYSYALLSHNLLEHGAYSVSTSAPFIPESFRLPGYPFYLYVFQYIGLPLWIATIVQMILSSLSVVLLYRIGKQFLSEKTAFIAAILFCFEWTSIFYSTLVMSDTLFVFSLLLSLYLFLRPNKSILGSVTQYAVAGANFGLAVLTRVMALYLLPLMPLAYVLLYRKELRPYGRMAAKLAVFGIVALLALAPWSLRNHGHFGVYDISSTPYINFTQFNLPLFYAYKDHISLDEAHKIVSDPLPSSTASGIESSLANKPIFQKIISDALHGNLMSYAEFHLIKTIPFFVTDGLRDINRTTAFIPIPPDQTNFTDLLLHRDFGGMLQYFLSPSPNVMMLIVGSSIWILITLLWLFQLCYATIRRTHTMWFVLLASGLIIYFAILTGPVSEHRYRMPAAPFMILLAVEGAYVLRQTYKHFRK